MVALARKSLIYEWRRFLPALLAVAFCGVLLLVQAALVLGIFSTASVSISSSSADLWVGYPGTRSIELGRPIAGLAEMRLRMDPEVIRVERFQWQEGSWRHADGSGEISIFVTGIDPDPSGLLFGRALPPELRQALLEPGAVIVDTADVDKLGIDIGSTAEINGHRVRLVGAARGLRALGGVNVVTSIATARGVGAFDPGLDSSPYLLASLAHPAAVESVKARLIPSSPAAGYAVWTRDEFSNRTITYWLFDTGAGLGFIFAAVVVVLVGMAITSQTLMGAIAGSIREYATLRALGVARSDLGRVVVEQAAWIGGGGLLVAAGVSGILLAFADAQSVPVTITIAMALVCGALVVGVALASGVLALRSLRNTDPALLLR